MTIQVITLVESKAREDKAHDLEVWRQAYNAVVVGLCAGDDWDSSVLLPRARVIADAALDDYCAKREEMGI